MTIYHAPVDEIYFVLRHIAEIENLASLPGFEEVTPALVTAILEEAGRLSSEVISPTNQPSDKQGARIIDECVVVADGLAAAYRQLIEGGWLSLPFSTQRGGQGLPAVLAFAVQEMIISSNPGFSICTTLTHGAAEAIEAHAVEHLKQIYLPKMISGEWTGTMNLTEPQAGTDVAAISTKAVPKEDHYLILGQKIFISWGDHDMSENIVHLVLARLPNSPPGTKGVSLFLVPKYLVDKTGEPHKLNDVHAVSLEHKLGIHSSPTCTMSFGENGGAVGYLIGEPNMGVACMFTMMNHARISVGLQGVGVAERSFQQAVAFANERVQGVPPANGAPAAIIHHPDVRRMLMLMKCLTEASRALAYAAMGSMDRTHSGVDTEDVRSHRMRADLLTPVVKGWCTEVAQEVTSLGIQVHGGMGYIEETGAAQHYRDARIFPIYEGTNGIQALDLIGRKFLGDNGKAMSSLVEDIEKTVVRLQTRRELDQLALSLKNDIEILKKANSWVTQNSDKSGITSGSVAYDFMMLVGTVAGGWLLAHKAFAALSRQEADANTADFYRAKIITATFYFQHVSPRARSHMDIIKSGSDAVMALPEEHFCL